MSKNFSCNSFLFALTLLLTGTMALPAQAQATDLLFSEYVEGSSNNKALEIYNGTGAAVDLSEYVVELYSNGAATPGSSLTLATAMATLADGATLVIANGSSNATVLAVTDITSGVANFNGNDAIALRRNGVVIDVIGVIGSNPGTLWGSGSTTTLNNTLRRIDTICMGDSDGFGNPTDITDQWVGFAQDTFDGLGSHSLNCGGVVNAPVMVVCGANLDLDEGTAGNRTVTATDNDGVIADIAITAISPMPVAGDILAGTFMAAAGGNPAALDVTVSDMVPAGSYEVELTATNSDATPQTATCTFTVNVLAPPMAGWVINEFLADPANDLAGDANGDGTRDATQDEFVEIVNTTGNSADISGWSISDAVSVRHVFPAGTLVANGAAILVFGGGTPTGDFGSAAVQVASTGALGLNNGGDTVTLAGTGGVVQAAVTYGAEGGNDASLTLDPDLTGAAYVPHSAAAGSGGALFSPGTRVDGSPFNTGFASDLFFSEYIEGSSNNKALEIYNGTGGAVDLSEYVVELYANGAVTPNNTLTLSAAMATLADGETLVIANASAAAAILAAADITSSVTFFNGNDAVALRRNGVIIDVIGVVGSNPGTEWGSGAATTLNHTLRRLATICGGDADGFDNPTDITDQWEGFAIDTLDGLGIHTTNCSGGGNQPVVADCGDDLPVVSGTAAMKTVTASDADGVITDIAISQITPTPATGSISAGSFSPASGGQPAALVITASSDLALGVYTVQITATNNDLVAQTANCEFDVTVAGLLTISQIQGSGLTSPFENQVVITEGNVVTAVDTNGFFIQTLPGMEDADPLTSEGLFVFTSTAPGVAVGDEVRVSGSVEEFFAFTQIGNSPSISIVSSGNPLPMTVILDSDNPSPAIVPQSAQMERYEGMLVELTGATVSGPSNQFGDFHAVIGPNRAFREPGIDFPGLVGLPVWDSNPELLEIDPDALGLPDLTVFAGDVVDFATGPLAFAFGDYQIQPTSISVTNNVTGPVPVRARQNGEFTVATQNMLRLFVNQPSAAGYLVRLDKFSRQIREVLGAPDILAVEEAENLTVLQDLANKIQTDDPTLNYTPYLIEGNDVGGIDIGFLVRDTVLVHAVAQIQANEMFEFNGVFAILHDRPPLLLEADYIGGATPFPISVIGIHNRSLSSIEDAIDGDRVRHKRFEQADRIAQYIQDMQTQDPLINLVVLGDFNAFEFTDGYVDSMGIITGNLDPLGALLPGIDRVNPDLINHTFDVPPSQRYSFNFDGNGQSLDHVLTSQPLHAYGLELQHGRSNSDTPGSLLNLPNTALRCSDHDGSVLFINPVPLATEGIVDNSDAAFGTIGTWTSSTAVPGFFGADYLYHPMGSGADSANWTLVVPVSGQYQVYARWTSHPNRASDATYSVEHADGSTIRVVNQRQDGGQWNRLGTFNLDGGVPYSVALSDAANGFVIADAIRWVRHENIPPTADQITIDNFDAEFTTEGTWTSSTVVAGFFGADYQYHAMGSGSATATWTATFLASAPYEVYARWTNHPNRADNVTYSIEHDGGTTDVVIDQMMGGGQFKLLGVFNFSLGSSYSVSIDDDAGGFVIADAVQFRRVVNASASEIVIDNGDEKYLARGDWDLSSQIAGFLGANYHFTRKGNGSDTAQWTLVSTQTGNYQVQARWTAHPNRASNATYRIHHDAGFTDVAVDQRQNGGSWQNLGAFHFTAGAAFPVILSDEANGFVIADAIRWVEIP